ncbi:hypothetical protein SAMN05192553_106115 [Cyclobacterium xiamenense]|uniref:Uncharacterized protein n=1 Tax=Cyclobacterium xiamenense TaxID=1297121 RepID=A0A1H7ABQ3_9BACT|nr:hypothetical protein [Cyclobacterium xiamenense]SEJ61954.1 hypothetical protein SAMN05192553_106115 [Cyclobacterium xiamenense]
MNRKKQLFFFFLFKARVFVVAAVLANALGFPLPVPAKEATKTGTHYRAPSQTATMLDIDGSNSQPKEAGLPAQYPLTLF